MSFQTKIKVVTAVEVVKLMRNLSHVKKMNNLKKKKEKIKN